MLFVADALLGAWEPTRADLDVMDTGLIPHYASSKPSTNPSGTSTSRTLERIPYCRVSTTFPGGKLNCRRTTLQAIAALFSKTVRADVADILAFLHTPLCAIREMAWNTRKPELTNRGDYNRYVEGLGTQIEAFITQLPQPE